MMNQPVAKETVFGGIEAGGTKFVCAVGTGPEDIRAETRFPTTTPEETVGRAIAFFRQEAAKTPLAAVGVAAFGPVDLNPRSSTYGYITTTPKPGWAHYNFAGTLHSALGIPVGFDTDVNGAALGEARWGAAQGLDTFLYLTIGTGVGGGGLVNGQLMHGLVHPEMGHIILRRDPQVDPFSGTCPYHKDCLEGLACGPAVHRRWNQDPAGLPDDHPAWALEAGYIAQALASYIFILSPQRIILGGGIMKKEFLFPMIRRGVQEILNGYVQADAIVHGIDEYIVPPGLPDRSGVVGAIALAELAVGAAG